MVADRFLYQSHSDNLFSNAIKFSEQKKVTASINDNKDNVLLTVAMRYFGISEEDQKKFYLKFQKLTAMGSTGKLKVHPGWVCQL